MPRHLINVSDSRPSLDIASYGRPGPGRRDRLSTAEVELISRTVRRAPEVMVKVLTHGGKHLKSVQRHLEYLDRKGELEIETDEGERIAGEGVEKELLEDWDLDLEEDRRRVDLGPVKDRSPPKLVHKILFSMPAGTPPQKVLEAVRDFAREEFALQHRYAMVLHTDEPHPHVHMVVKAVSEQGVRLNVRKATLREWRREFARHLRAHGVEANATERAVRGNRLPAKLDGIYRSEQRSESHHTRARAEGVARELLKGGLRIEQGKARLLETRREVQRGWFAVADILAAEGRKELANEVWRFGAEMPPTKTERELIAEELRRRMREGRVRDQPVR
ncbi:MAG: relaxase [Acidobacteria bacterium]|nr:MAG: relaxase [Acidobacteriota bacterium]